MLSFFSATPALRVPAPIMQLQGAPVGVSAPAGEFAGGVVPTKTDSSILVQGGSLRTWSYRSPAVEQVQVVLSTEGRPLDADIELWHGPDNTPCKMRVYVENGQLRPFSAVVETPRRLHLLHRQRKWPVVVEQPVGERLSVAWRVQTP